MGMVLVLSTLADENIDRVLADPPLVWRVVAPHDPDAYEQSRREQAKPSFLGALLGKGNRRVPEVEDLALGDAEGISTELDKAWHGIHYLLTGTADEGEPPWTFLVSGGRTVGDIEVGYGPARVFTSAETNVISKAIVPLTDDELRARFSPADMTAKKIYPHIWSRGSPDQETIGYLLEYFALLRGFLRQAAEAKVGIVLALL